jgi:hypothetical protein
MMIMTLQKLTSLPDAVLLCYSGNDTQVVFSLGASNFHVQNLSLILIPSRKTQYFCGLNDTQVSLGVLLTPKKLLTK